jgi:hypothetical protein
MEKKGENTLRIKGKNNTIIQGAENSPININQVAPIDVDEILKQFQVIANSDFSTLKGHFGALTNTHIQRKETTNLSNWINSTLSEKDLPIAVLKGNAGYGKSVILKNLVSDLQRQNIPIIALKADIRTVHSLSDLKAIFELEHSFRKVFQKIVDEKRRLVIIIDQFDALSLSLSADRSALATYLDLIQTAVSIENIRIVFACRTYDLNYDPMIKSIIVGDRQSKAKEVETEVLTNEQVQTVMKQLQIVEPLSNTLNELLKVPLHLDIFTEVYNDDLDINQIETLEDLYKELWEQKIVDTNKLSQAELEAVLLKVAEKMSKRQEISIPKRLLEDEYTILKALYSKGLLKENDQKIQFFHQSFFDYVFARYFIKQDMKLEDYVLNNHQGLFIRSQIAQVLTYLKNTKEFDYIKTNEVLLVDTKCRFHLKLLLTNLLSFETNPTAAQKRLVNQYILSDDALRFAFFEKVNSKQWWVYLEKNGQIDKLFNQYLEEYTTSTSDRFEKYTILFFNYMARSINTCPQETIDYIHQLPRFDKKTEFVFRMLNNLKEWRTNTPIQLYENYKSEANRLPFWRTQVLEKATSYHPDWVIQTILEFLPKEIETFLENATDKYSVSDLDFFDNKIDFKFFETIYKLDIGKGITFSIDVLSILIEKTQWKIDKSQIIRDRIFYQSDNDMDRNGHSTHFKLFKLLQATLTKIAEEDSNSFLKAIKRLLQTNYQSFIVLILKIYTELPKQYAPQIYLLFEQYCDVELIKKHTPLAYNLRKAIGKAYIYFLENEQQSIKQYILSVKTDDETTIQSRIFTEGKYRPKNEGGLQMLFLQNLPKEVVKNDTNFKKRYQELERKFGRELDEMETGRSSSGFWGVPSPIPEDRLDKLSFEQLIKAFEKYDKEYKGEFNEGSSLELARAYEELVKQQPNKYFPLVEELIKNSIIEEIYIFKGLNALFDCGFNPSESIRLLKKYIQRFDIDGEYTTQLIWIFDKIIDLQLIDDELLRFLGKCTLEHNDPKEDKEQNHIQQGINSVRGAAVEKLSKINYEPEYADYIFDILNQAAEDKTLAVRCTLIQRLAYLNDLDKERNLNLFLKLVKDKNSDILAVSVWSVQCMIHVNFAVLKDYFIDLLSIDKNQKAIGTILMRAWLNGYENSKSLLEKAFSIHEDYKKGAIENAFYNVTDNRAEAKCWDILNQFISNQSEKISQEYEWKIKDFEETDFDFWFPLMEKYVLILRKDNRYFHEYLLKCINTHYLECLDLVAHFQTYQQTDNIWERNTKVVLDVVLRAYNAILKQDNTNQMYKEKSMDIFDKMLQHPAYRGVALEAVKELDE